jgi:hypothetical protein
MSFFISHFLQTVKRSDIIYFKNIENGDTRQIFVDLKLLHNYTDFFAEKDQFIVDCVYTLPFDIDIAVEAIDHIQTLFTKLEKSDNIFRLLVAYDYFCIPIVEIYNYIFETSNFSDQNIKRWSIQVCNEYPSDLCFDLLNKLYDVYFRNNNLYHLVWSPSKEVIFFLLQRKWVTDIMDKENYVKKASQLEFYLCQTILHFVDMNLNEKDKEKDKDKEIETIELFQKMWSLLYYDYLSKDILMSISNHVISHYITTDLALLISKRMGFFQRELNNKIDSLFYMKSRFTCSSSHVEPKLFDRLQVMDNRKRWYNGEIIRKTDTHMTVHFEQFSDRYDEEISVDQHFRFLPYGLLQKDKICPCDLCIRDMKLLIQV